MDNAIVRGGPLNVLKGIEWISLGCLFLALVALALIRINMTDTPWHIATARYAFESGHWPVHNTFSYTYPDYPLFQQYPIYQTLLYLTFQMGGWEALSLLHCALWLLIFTLCVRWGGSWRWARNLNLIWLLALLGLQRRMILRPDILTILWLVSLLLFIDGYRNGKKWPAILFVLIQLLMVNSHQLFPLGLGIQGAFLAHVLISRTYGGRWGISQEDSNLAILPLFLALLGSIFVCFLTPLGSNIFHVTSHTLGSLSNHREHVQEFAPFYSSSYVLKLAISSTVLVFIAFWKTRHNWRPFELFLWLMGVVLLLSAIRGAPFYILFSVGLFARSFARDSNQVHTLTNRTIRSFDCKVIARIVATSITIGLCIAILQVRWLTPSRVLGGTQPGIGLALGVWPQHAIRFIKENPPPGRMINMTWYAGNPLIMELFPSHPVFVDPRFETYPRSFLLKTIRAAEDIHVLYDLISQYNPSWMVAELRVGKVRKIAAQLIKEGTWIPVFADTVLLVLVKNSPKNQEYIASYSLDLKNFSPPDFLEAEPDLLALQQLRMAGFYRDLGLETKSNDMLESAKKMAKKYVTVREALKKFE